MKDNMLTLKEMLDKNDNLKEFGLTFLMMYSAGYTMEDFKAFADELLADDDVKEAVEVALPLFEYTLKSVKEE